MVVTHVTVDTRSMYSYIMQNLGYMGESSRVYIVFYRVESSLLIDYAVVSVPFRSQNTPLTRGQHAKVVGLTEN
jgi:hypothetical protein